MNESPVPESKHRQVLADDLEVPVETLGTLSCAVEDCHTAATLRPVFLVPVRNAGGPVEQAEVSMPQLVVCAEHVSQDPLEYVGEEGIIHFYRVLEAGGQKPISSRPVLLRHDAIGGEDAVGGES